MTFLYYLIILMIMLIYIPIPLLNYTAIHTFQYNKLLCLSCPACAKAVPTMQRRGEPNLELGYTSL